MDSVTIGNGDHMHEVISHTGYLAHGISKAIDTRILEKEETEMWKQGA